MNILYTKNGDFDFPEANKIQVANMCKAFKENGCGVTLLAFGKNIEEIEKRYKLKGCIETHFLKIKIRFFICGDILLFLYFLVNHKKYHVIYTRDIVFALLTKFFFKRKRVFLEIHDIPKRYWWKILHKKFTLKLNCIIVISQGLKDGLLDLGLNKNNFIVLHDGVNLSSFDIPLSREDARKEIGLPLKKTVVVYAGSTKEDRDIPALVETAKKMPEVYFVIFGKNQKYIHKAKNEMPNLLFKGYIDNPALAYKAADILFAGYTKKVPTINYMSPLKIFEYMAAKRPILVADFPRIREILDESEVYFYKSENSDEIVSRITEIMENKYIANTKMLKAFNKAKKYTWKERAQKIINKFQDF